MTALQELARLECPGRWWPEAGAEPLEVYLAVGKAELVVQDTGGTALAHWSLPALERRDAGGLPARYAPDQGASEEVEIEEPEMVAALDRVIAAVERGRRRPRAWRRIAVTGVLVAALGAGLAWLPEVLVVEMAEAMPAAQRVQVGQRLLAELERRVGPRCTDRAGMEALGRLQARVSREEVDTIAVLRDLPVSAVALPGGIVALSDRALAAHDDPDVAAGHVLAASLEAKTEPTIAAFLDTLPPLAFTRFLATGSLDYSAIASYAQKSLERKTMSSDPAALKNGFGRAGIAWAPWAAAVGLLDGPAGRAEARPALDDASWLALREICAG